MSKGLQLWHYRSNTGSHAEDALTCPCIYVWHLNVHQLSSSFFFFSVVSPCITHDRNMLPTATYITLPLSNGGCLSPINRLWSLLSSIFFFLSNRCYQIRWTVIWHMKQVVARQVKKKNRGVITRMYLPLACHSQPSPPFLSPRTSTGFTVTMQTSDSRSRSRMGHGRLTWGWGFTLWSS